MGGILDGRNQVQQRAAFVRPSSTSQVANSNGPAPAAYRGRNSKLGGELMAGPMSGYKDISDEALRSKVAIFADLADLYSGYVVNGQDVSALIAEITKETIEFFKRLETKNKRQETALSVIEYNKVFDILIEILSPDYLQDIVDNPRYWHQPGERATEALAALDAVSQQLLENIRQLSTANDLNLQISLKSLQVITDDDEFAALYSMDNKFGTFIALPSDLRANGQVCSQDEETVAEREISFYTWMQGQKKGNHDSNYSPRTIGNYIKWLKDGITKLSDIPYQARRVLRKYTPDEQITNLFYVPSASDFDTVLKSIRCARNYSDVNMSGSGSFAAALSQYERFLIESANDRSSQGFGSNISDDFAALYTRPPTPPAIPKPYVSSLHQDEIAARERQVEFRAWMGKQLKSNGNYYAANTIASYTSQLLSGTARLELNASVHTNLFQYANADEFLAAQSEIQQCRGFDEFDKSTNRSYSNALKQYAKFLGAQTSNNVA